MRKSYSYIIAATFFCFAILAAVLPISAQAADEEPPQVVSSSISPRVVAYQGNATAGYTTVVIKTNEPTRGTITVVNSSRTATINLSTTDFKTEHVVNWVPWDHAKREPLPPGEYLLKLNLQDQGLNQSVGFPLGKLTVVAEPNPKALIENVSADPAVVAPQYNSTEPVTAIQYQLNRHAEVQVVLKNSSSGEVFHGPKEKLAPGLHKTAWNGRDDRGNIVRDGDYDVLLKTIELNYNYPSFEQKVSAIGKLTVKGGEYGIPQSRMKEIVAEAVFDDTELTPDGDGVKDKVTGSVTLREPAKVTVWITNKLNYHVNSVIAYQQMGAGTHAFSWDGRDAMGSMMPNGTYSLKVSIEKDGIVGDLLFDQAQLTLKNSYDIQIPQPVQRVRVTSPTAQMDVNPMSQGYKAKQGEVFTVLEFVTGPYRYRVLLTDNITGWVKTEDVELLDLETIPLQWGRTLKDGVEARRSPSPIDTVVEKVGLDVRLRILHQDGNWYRVLLPSGKQAFVSVADLALDTANGDDKVYTVVAGDTLWKIAQKNGTTIDAIIKANNLDPNAYLTVGQSLIMPAAGTTQPPVQPPIQPPIQPPVQPPVQPPTSGGQGNTVVHVVASGDTLWKIAAKYGTTVAAVVKANNLDPNKYLAVGQALTIPQSGTALPPVLPPASGSQGNTVVYVVRSGDTLWKIASKYGTTVAAIVKANNLDPNKYLAVGQTLTIPVLGTVQPPTSGSQGNPVVHTVQSGDTLWRIAMKYGTTVNAIIKANNLDPNKYLAVGQKLIIQVL